MKVTLRTITTIFLVVGVGLLSYSLTLPYYKNDKAAAALLESSHTIDKQEYYRKEANLRTSKNTMMDLGAGIAITSGILLFYFLLSRTRTLSDLQNLKTPNKAVIFISANVVWLLLIPGTFWYYYFRGSRGDYPPFADSIGIPIFTQVSVFMFLIIPLNIVLILTTYKSRLPARLFIKSGTYGRSPILWEVFFGFWLMINLLFCFAFIWDGDHISILVNMFFTFLLLSLRAGKISKFSETTATAGL
jgi:hypothetical protein